MNLLALLAAATLAVISSLAASAAEPEDLEMVQSITLPNLQGVTSVAVSGDGKFLYSAAYQAGALSTFKRDSETGQLTLVESLSGPDLRTAINVRLSRDEKYAAVATFSANKVAVFKRDAESGKLSKDAELSEGENGAEGLNITIDASFSPDNQFLYTSSAGGLGVFKFAGDQISFVQFEEAEGNLKDVRGCVLSPDGHWVYAVGHTSGTLGVFRRDETSGKLETVQMLSNDQEGIHSLRGAFRVTVSKDGRYVYVSSGRFQGDQAVSVFEVQSDGQLKVVQQLVNGMDDFGEFEGGNDIKVSPDGKSIFAATSVSDRLFRFGRDSETGRLTFISSQQAGVFAAPGAAGLSFSPDGKFVYVADERENAIEVFKLP